MADSNRKHFGHGGYNKLVHSPNDPVAGGGTNPMVVSDYMSYGSYSGADIKVVVHYPRDLQGLRNSDLRKQANDAKIKEEEELLEDINNFLSSGFNSEMIKRKQLTEDRIKFLNQENMAIEEENNRIKSIPTTKTLAECQTFSWSIFREKDPVRTLGSVYPRAYTRGPRTISGSMVFTQFYEHVLHEVIALNLRYHSTGTSDYDKYQQTTMLPDQLPPLDISLIFANEYGALSSMGLYGVEFFNEGGTFSIEDIYSESTVQYVARDIDPMRSIAQREIEAQGVSEAWTTTASDMLRSKQAMEYGAELRREPFI